MPDVFLDTNVLIYAAAGRKNEPRKAEIANRIIETEDFCLSVQVLQEFYVNVRKREINLPEEQTNAWIANLLEFECATIDMDIFITALGLSKRYQISYWDSALIAAAKRLGARTLMTEDLNSGQDYDGVVAHNPFIAD